MLVCTPEECKAFTLANSDHNGADVDGCDCAEILSLIEQGKIDTTPLITHRYKLADIEEAYHLFENKLDGVIKVAITE